MQNINHIDWATERPDLTDLDKPFAIKAYIENRAIYKIKRYFLLAKRSGKFYKTIAVSVLIFSALVPVILSTSIIYNVELRMLLASLSSFLVVVLFSVESVYNFREQWKSYKNAEDEITQELNLFHTSAEPYNGKNNEREKLLVMRVEGIILKERKETIEKLTSKMKELEKAPQVTGGST
jgi:Protein of unknown function (DUF4231)